MSEEQKQDSLTEDTLIAMVCMIAEVAHEVNRAYCKALGDDTQVPFDEAPDWQKQSAFDGVGYRVSHPEATAEQMHGNWMAQKSRDGWAYGPLKDVTHKMHPCMVPYHELPKEQQVKDHLFSAVVTTMVRQLGLSE